MAQAKKSKRHANAMKAYRQSVKRNLRNVKIKKGVRNAVRGVNEAIKAKDTGKLGELMSAAAAALDKAANHGTIHWKTAARRKSRLAKRASAPAQQNA